MRVSVDVRHVSLPGVGRFCTELAAALTRRDDGPEIVVLSGAGAGAARGWLGRAAFPPPRSAVPVRSRPFGAAEQWELPRVLRRRRVAVHHATHLSVPWRAGVPVVLTVHDLFPLTHPDHARSAGARTYYRAVLPAAVRRADAVVAVSDHTAAELERVLRVSPAAVIGHGVDHTAWADLPHGDPRLGPSCATGPGALGGPYVLYVGTAKPHKNLVTLLAAHRANDRLPPLVLAGPTPAEAEAILPGATTTGRVHAQGRVPDDQLPALYRGAAVVAVPSLYEGVGLAALEAMSFGVPVVAADAPGLRDTVGQAAALAPPTEVGAWADALDRMARPSALRDVVVERGRARAAGHRWADTAAAYVAVYESVAARS